MTVHPLRLCVLWLIFETSLASRPEADEVHIATSGHFIKNSAHGSHHHQRKRHGNSLNDWADQSDFNEGTIHHQREQATSDLQPYEALEHRHVQRHEYATDKHRQHKSRKHPAHDHHVREWYKRKWERSKREFYNDAAVSYEEAGNYTWSECMPYWICRMAFVALVIYNLVRTQRQQEKQSLALKESIQEPRMPTPLKEEDVCESIFASYTPIIYCGDTESEDEKAQPTEERLGKAIDEQLCEVERQLRHEAKAGTEETGNDAEPASVTTDDMKTTEQGVEADPVTSAQQFFIGEDEVYY